MKLPYVICGACGALAMLAVLGMMFRPASDPEGFRKIPGRYPEAATQISQEEPIEIVNTDTWNVNRPKPTKRFFINGIDTGLTPGDEWEYQTLERKKRGATK
jgi:hypothetical protein